MGMWTADAAILAMGPELAQEMWAVVPYERPCQNPPCRSGVVAASTRRKSDDENQQSGYGLLGGWSADDQHLAYPSGLTWPHRTPAAPRAPLKTDGVPPTGALVMEGVQLLYNNDGENSRRLF